MRQHRSTSTAGTKEDEINLSASSDEYIALSKMLSPARLHEAKHEASRRNHKPQCAVDKDDPSDALRMDLYCPTLTFATTQSAKKGAIRIKAEERAPLWEINQ